MRVAADHIALTLQSHEMTAQGHVETELRAESGGQRAGVLDRGQAARVNADRFTYGGDGGQASYAGAVQLWQGETTIRCDRLVLERESGDLDATGGARATLALEEGPLVGRADRIHYTDAGRALEYGPAGAGGQSAGALAQLSGTQGDLRASRVVITLAGESRALERMDATDRVTMKVGGRTILGTTLRYAVRDERYDVTGTPAVPVTLTRGCDKTTGRTLTWYRGTDRMLIDGRDAARTETKTTTGPCAESRTP